MASTSISVICDCLAASMKESHISDIFQFQAVILFLSEIEKYISVFTCKTYIKHDSEHHSMQFVIHTLNGSDNIGSDQTILYTLASPVVRPSQRVGEYAGHHLSVISFLL